VEADFDVPDGIIAHLTGELRHDKASIMAIVIKGIDGGHNADLDTRKEEPLRCRDGAVLERFVMT
jgi:hypothetical protein